MSITKHGLKTSETHDQRQMCESAGETQHIILQ